jgi:hypothetical protein
MRDLIMNAPYRVKRTMRVEISDDCISMDNFFVLISAFRSR